MLIVLSPAKTLDYNPSTVQKHTEPRLLSSSQELVSFLKRKNTQEIQQLMHVSEKIADLNVARFRSFSLPFTKDNSKQAALAFKGDVYQSFEAATFSEKEMDFAQQHVRILSGLYGILRPLDLMQPYRLEMGTKLKTDNFKNLYEFWDTQITELINADLSASKSEILLNLASKEYFSSIQPKALNAPVLNIHFKEDRNGKLKVISFNAKKARGRMANLIVKNSITDKEALKGLNVDNYIYNEALSTEWDWMFTK